MGAPSPFQFDMKSVLVLATLVALSAAAAVGPKRQAPVPLKEVPRPVAIIQSSSVKNDDGSYQFNFESEDQIRKEEQGSPQLADPEDPEKGVVTVMRGSYSYVSPEGQPITVNWVADEKGFRAEGDHLPK